MSSDYDMRADENASRIRGHIEHLSRSHWRIPLIERDYGEFWGHAKEIVDLFKTLKPLRKDDREELWEDYSNVRDETRQQQEKERFERECKSERLRDNILSEVSSARVNDLFGFDPPDIEEMKRLSGVLKDARRMLSEYKGDMFGGHKQVCFDEIQDTQREHDAWWQDLKRHKSQKHEEFQARVRNNLEKNRERLRKANDALDSCNRSADELRDKISSAWNDDWASDAEGWLSELEDKIRDIEDSIERIEGWIEEDEDKLD